MVDDVASEVLLKVLFSPGSMVVTRTWPKGEFVIDSL